MPSERRPDDDTPATGGGTDAQEQDPEIGPGTDPDAERQGPDSATPGGRP